MRSVQNEHAAEHNIPQMTHGMAESRSLMLKSVMMNGTWVTVTRSSVAAFVIVRGDADDLLCSLGSVWRRIQMVEERRVEPYHVRLAFLWGNKRRPRFESNARAGVVLWAPDP